MIRGEKQDCSSGIFFCSTVDSYTKCVKSEMLLVLPVLYKGRNSFHPESRANFALLAVALLRFKTLHNQCLDRCTTLETVMGFLTLQCLCSTAEHCLFIREASEASTFISFLIDVLWRFIYFPLKHSSMKVEMRVLMPRSQRTVHFFLYKDFVHHICSSSECERGMGEQVLNHCGLDWHL